MTKKNDKRLCWNCEGNVSQHIAQCPYCGVDVTQPVTHNENKGFKGFASPFQSAPQQEIPQPPYARPQNKDMAVTDDEWNSALNEKKAPPKEEEAGSAGKRELVAFLLLLPGIVFFFFGVALAFFSSDGVLTLSWNQHFAYFYFVGAAPLLYLGYRALK